jgi:hypothetical protein
MSRLFLRMGLRSWGLAGRWRWNRKEKKCRLYIPGEMILDKITKLCLVIVAGYSRWQLDLPQLNSNVTTRMRGVLTLNRDMS